MMHRISRWWLLLLMPGLGMHVSAQEGGWSADASGSKRDSLSRVNSVLILFDRNLNTYNWMGRLFVDTVFGKTSVRIAQNYNTNIIQVDAGSGGRRKLVSSQENLNLGVGEKLNENLGLQFRWSSLVYSDDKAVGLSNASGHSALGGLDLTPLPFLSITPLFGYRWDNQETIRDRGPSYMLAGELREIDLDGYRLLGRGQYQEDRLDPRSLANHFGRVGVQKTFIGRTRDSLEFAFNRLKREFYALADSTIESRIDNVLSFTNLLDYEIDRNLLATVFATVSTRGLDKDLRALSAGSPQSTQFNTRIEEFRLDTYFQAEYRSPDGGTAGQVRVGYTERNEAHTAKAPANLTLSQTVLFNERDKQEKTKDNLARRTSLSGLLTLPLSLSDRLTVSGGAGILRYDTPSALNVEDRDELLIVGSVATSHRITPALELGIALDGTLSHTVYLLKERSANNNINRVLRLAPRTLVRPTGFLTSANMFEVLANYTVYDFEREVAEARSFSYRQFAWIDSTVVGLTERIGLHFFSYIKLYERGQLNWAEFTERTENAFTDQTYALQLRFVPSPLVLLAVGIQYFSQSRYRFEEREKQLESFQRSIGPTCVLSYDLGRSGQLNFHGWYESRRLTDGTTRALASMTMTVLLNF
jgi:hypothetical protein